MRLCLLPAHESADGTSPTSGNVSFFAGCEGIADIKPTGDAAHPRLENGRIDLTPYASADVFPDAPPWLFV